VERDEDQIAILVGLADQLLEILARQQKREARYAPDDYYR
jgi:hypothetical protein